MSRSTYLVTAAALASSLLGTGGERLGEVPSSFGYHGLMCSLEGFAMRVPPSSRNRLSVASATVGSTRQEGVCPSYPHWKRHVHRRKRFFWNPGVDPGLGVVDHLDVDSTKVRCRAVAVLNGDEPAPQESWTGTPAPPPRRTGRALAPPMRRAARPALLSCRSVRRCACCSHPPHGKAPIGNRRRGCRLASRSRADRACRRW